MAALWLLPSIRILAAVKFTEALARSKDGGVSLSLLLIFTFLSSNRLSINLVIGAGVIRLIAADILSDCLTIERERVELDKSFHSGILTG